MVLKKRQKDPNISTHHAPFIERIELDTMNEATCIVRSYFELADWPYRCLLAGPFRSLLAKLRAIRY